ncbi:MAG: MOSC domain-containing protein [Acidimicrobiia bacterium]|nr:MOSC domain-containing protein [Acidimicrobiia bacterium]MYB25440.1 MOSC domain-containing protein [Acidimicrobiia bacterium]MYE66806.1 MOSC domain-containing protein [Acidimicrobiia bacterium]MYJ12995.1 MOSC domain-containing protein [Acidimicrobiia bacterium]
MDDGLRGRVAAVCVGKVGELESSGRTVVSAFVKRPVEGPVRVYRLGVEGDEHEYPGHGGPDGAVLVYSRDHYPFWRERGVDIPAVGAFAENLTVDGLTEAEVRLGDVFEAGTSVLQVSEPRSPCYKIAARYGRKDISVVVQDTGFTGYLMRVLQEGCVAAGDELRLTERDTTHHWTVAQAGRVINVDRNDIDGAERLCEVEALSLAIKDKLRARIARRETLGLDLDRLYLSGQVET